MAKGHRKAKAKHAAKVHVSKTGAVWRMTAAEATLAHKPRYNGFACGHGVHGEMKYSRAKAKRVWRKQFDREGASRGSFLFGGRCLRHACSCLLLLVSCSAALSVLGRFASWAICDTMHRFPQQMSR